MKEARDRITYISEHVRDYHFRVPIEGGLIWQRGSGAVVGLADGHPTLEAIKKTQGVAMLSLEGAYRVSIIKGHLYSWNEIEPSVLAILNSHDAMEKL